MTLVDLLVLLIYFVLIALGKVGVSALTLAILVVVLIAERILLGERFQQRTTRVG